jgi:hypothetical protein
MGQEMNIEVITSFNQHYYDLIGKKSLGSWLTHWPTSLSITCYVEDMRLADHARVRQIDFDQLGHDYRSFQAAAVKGRMHIFAKKAYSVIHAMNHSMADRIMWLDADVLTKQDVPLDLLHSIMPDHVLSTHMGVTYTESKTGRKGPWLVPETGVFVINARHAMFDLFRQEYQRRYQERDFDDLRRGYDNDVYGATITKFDVPSLDLCSGLKKAYKTPLKHTVLGAYLDHYKAKHSKNYFAESDQ